MKHPMHMTQARVSSVIIFAMTASLCFLTSGCANIMTGGPPFPTYQSKAVQSLIDKYSKADEILPTRLTVEKRNGIMEELIFLIDVNYSQFEGQLYMGRSSFDTATDLAIIGLGAAGAIVDATGTQAILAVISGGIAGGRVSINKNFFREQSANALISTMRSVRKAKLNSMRGAQSLGIADYPMARALGDITDYYNAGTIVGALQSIVAEAGKKEQDAAAKIEKKVQDKIELQYKKTAKPLRDRIGNWLDSDLEKNVPAFAKWLEAKTPPVTITPAFWIFDANETELIEAIQHFNIPQ